MGGGFTSMSDPWCGPFGGGGGNGCFPHPDPARIASPTPQEPKDKPQFAAEPTKEAEFKPHVAAHSSYSRDVRAL